MNSKFTCVCKSTKCNSKGGGKETFDMQCLLKSCELCHTLNPSLCLCNNHWALSIWHCNVWNRKHTIWVKFLIKKNKWIKVTVQNSDLVFEKKEDNRKDKNKWKIQEPAVISTNSTVWTKTITKPWCRALAQPNVSFSFCITRVLNFMASFPTHGTPWLRWPTRRSTFGWQEVWGVLVHNSDLYIMGY